MSLFSVLSAICLALWTQDFGGEGGGAWLVGTGGEGLANWFAGGFFELRLGNGIVYVWDFAWK